MTSRGAYDAGDYRLPWQIREDLLPEMDETNRPYDEVLWEGAEHNPWAGLTMTARIRALAEAEPTLRRSEIAKRLGTKLYLVRSALDGKCPRCGDPKTLQAEICRDCHFAERGAALPPTRTEDGVQISLTNRAGEVVGFALVDDQDAALAEYRWHISSSGYVSRTERGRHVLLHRAILGLCHGDPRVSDHISGDKLDNRRGNLRITTHAENSQNLDRTGTGSSHYRGVSRARSGRWKAQISIEGTTRYIGTFDTQEQAAVAARNARRTFYTHANEARHPQPETSKGLRNFTPVFGVTAVRTTVSVDTWRPDSSPPSPPEESPPAAQLLDDVHG